MLDIKIKETYEEKGKQLYELLQEWIDENNSLVYCKIEKEKVKYYCR